MASPQNPNPQDGRSPWLLAALVLFVLHVLCFDFFEIDDAYISFRYAGNLLDGHGLVFNPGDPVEGYSNLSWVLLSAAGMAVGLSPLVWARILGLACAVGVLLLVPSLVRRLDPEAERFGGMATVFTACCGPLACWSFAGLETSLFALLAVLGWRAGMDRRGITAAVVGLLLVLTRPEGMALGTAFCLWAAWPGGRGAPPGSAPSWRRWLGPVLFLGGLAVHFLWRHAVYGQWLPNTYYAKTGDLLGQLRTGLPYGADFLRSYLAPLAGVALWAAVATRGQAFRNREIGKTLALCAFWLAYTVLIGGDMLGMFRFFVPVLPLLATVAAVLVGRALQATAPAGNGRPALWVTAVVAAFLILPSTVGKERRLIDTHLSEKNLGGWKLVGDALATQLPPGTTIALGPAGYIPYRTGFVTYDLLGITDRHIAHRKVAFSEGYAGHEKHDGAYILGRRPDYLLLGNVDVTDQPRRSIVPPYSRELDIFQNPAFARNYELVSLPLAGGKYLNCFRRKN